MGKMTAATMLETVETELGAKLDAPMSQAVFMNILHCITDRYIALYTHTTVLSMETTIPYVSVTFRAVHGTVCISK
jgi:hypothetical protein